MYVSYVRGLIALLDGLIGTSIMGSLMDPSVSQSHCHPSRLKQGKAIQTESTPCRSACTLNIIQADLPSYSTTTREPAPHPCPQAELLRVRQEKDKEVAELQNSCWEYEKKIRTTSEFLELRDQLEADLASYKEQLERTVKEYEQKLRWGLTGEGGRNTDLGQAGGHDEGSGWHLMEGAGGLCTRL
jgi:hypothetical protein